MTPEEAKKIIGKSAPGDWTISPTTHPAELEQKAPALYARLAHSSRADVAERYERCDREATEGQARFKQVAEQASVAVLVVACLGGVIAALGAFADAVVAKVALGVCAAVSVVAGALAAMWLSKLREAKLLDAWMRNRAKAESARIEYFERVTAQTDDVGLALLALEYFRRYQLEVQRAYYDGRGKQHRAAAATTLNFRLLAGFFGAVATGVAGVLGVWGPQQGAFSALAALGVMAAAFSAYAVSRESIGQDSRNGERYERTFESLAALHERLDDVRSAVHAGDVTVLEAFVKAVHEELSVEHRQWLAQSERWTSALADLEKQLDAKKSSEDEPASATQVVSEAS